MVKKLKLKVRRGRLTEEQVAEHLLGIYERSFSGKNRGRFQISKGNLLRLAGRRRFTAGFLEKVENELFEEGFKFTELPEDYFAVIDLEVMAGYRKAPKSLIDEIIEEDQNQ